MNGSIHLTSQPNVGSKFSVELNFKYESNETWFQSFKEVESSRKHIILITDDEMISSGLQVINKKSGINLSAFKSTDLNHIKPDGLSYDFAIIDLSSISIDYNEINLKFSSAKCIFLTSNMFNDFPENSVSVSRWPLLLTDILPHVGYSSRSRDRKENLTESKSSQSTQVYQNFCNTQIKLLVAHDDEGNIELYKAYFEKTNWDVTYVNNGVAALEAFNQAKFDICILDYRMPGMDGIQVIKKIRSSEIEKKTKTVPLVLITAELVDAKLKTLE